MNLLDMLKTDMVKALATVFLFCVVMAALGLYIYDTIAAIPVPSSVTSVLVVAVTTALSIVGIHQGVTIANGVAKDTAVAVVHEQNTGSLVPMDTTPAPNQEVK